MILQQPLRAVMLCEASLALLFCCPLGFGWAFLVSIGLASDADLE